jgi:apolipoprotein N-acyltransferase
MTTSILSAPSTACRRTGRLAAAAQLAGAVAASGVLLGISTPLSIRWTLAPLAWFWLVPLLIALGAEAPAWRWFLTALGAGTITGLIATWGVGQAVGRGWAPVYFAYAGFTLAAPFVPFLIVRRLAGWPAALWSIPLVWPLTEWGLRHVEGTLTWLTIAVTQANSVWTNQFADLFGEWGLTAWVMLFNVALYRAWTAGGARRLVKPAAVMLIPALAYSAIASYVEHRRATAAPEAMRLKVLLVQPDVDVHQTRDAFFRRAIESAVNLTDKAVAESKPDLILWPEEAVPLTLRANPPARAFVTEAVADWGTPLITGAFDTRRGAQNAPMRSATNAALLLIPGPPGSNRSDVRFGPSHAKRRLVPFVETIPYARSIPLLRKIRVAGSSAVHLQPGYDRQLLSWRSDQGWKVTAAAPICYEELFDSDFADYARRGAQFFAVLSDDEAFGKAASSATLAAIGRLRAIETRRPVARATETGVTAAIDATGRIVTALPSWQAGTAEVSLVLNNRVTLQSRYPELFPALCGCALFPLSLLMSRKSRRSL